MDTPGKEVKEPEQRARALLNKTREGASTALHEHPVITVASASALALAAATFVGAGPVAVAGGAAYLAYRWLKRSPGPLYEPGHRESAA